ncbi:MAG: hypothetical protein M3O31_13610, partial [Acidobacteriota bacterium]|nr:hypothetical protein [Acidobacteriota bacterium]
MNSLLPPEPSRTQVTKTPIKIESLVAADLASLRFCGNPVGMRGGYSAELLGGLQTKDFEHEGRDMRRRQLPR